MAAVKIDGTAIAKRIRESIHADIDEKKQSNPRYIPSLKIIQGAQTDPNAELTPQPTLYTDKSDSTKWVIAVILVSLPFPLTLLGASASFHCAV